MTSGIPFKNAWEMQNNKVAQTRMMTNNEVVRNPTTH
jgi:hypothetical protein